MLLCERLGSPIGAARFAQAAAHQAALLRSENRLQGQDLSAREGRLWTNLFFYALDARSYQVCTPRLSLAFESIELHDDSSCTLNICRPGDLVRARSDQAVDYMLAAEIWVLGAVNMVPGR